MPLCLMAYKLIDGPTTKFLEIIYDEKSQKKDFSEIYNKL